MTKPGVSYRIRSWLADRIRPEAAPKPPPRRVHAPAPARADLATQERIAVEASLRALIAKAPNVIAGRINLIGLGRIKEKFGAEWNRIVERADRIARNVIEKRLAQGDVYCAWEEDGYLMIFATLSAEQAQVKCALIANEIARALLGFGEEKSLAVTAATARIDADLQLHDVQAIDELAAQAAMVEAGEAASPPSAGCDEFAHEDRLAKLQFGYRPVWDTARGAIATYLCVASLPSPSPSAADAAGRDANDNWLVRLDRAVQRRVIDDLNALLAHDQRVLLMMPVHYETLVSWPRRQDYVAQLEQLPTPTQQLLVADIRGTPTGVTQSRLVELVAPLRRYCRAVAMRVPFAAADFAPMKLAGAIVVGCDIGRMTGAELGVIQEMGPFQRAAEKAGLACYIRGIRTRSLAAAALAAGFSYIAGDAVAEMTPRPATAVRYNVLDIYRPLLRAESEAVDP